MGAVSLAQVRHYLETLCSVKPNRRTGSPGNREATGFFARTIEPWGYDVDTTPFNCLDFAAGSVSLTAGDDQFDIFISPYSLGCDVTAELVTVSTVEELEACRCPGKILLMRGDITSEQLMPKNFVFYNPDHHKNIYALLEDKQPAAIITATTRNPDAVGALYPFPLIEDGDFDIPTMYCTDKVGEEIAGNSGRSFSLKADARRIPSTACNVIARKNPAAGRKVCICAHIDAYAMPGALDNASGTVVLLLLAQMLEQYEGGTGIEIAAFNGEDNYSAAGQMDYLRRYGHEMSKIEVVINIDDVGSVDGRTAYSLYECPTSIQDLAIVTFGKYAGLVHGDPWYQGDHMIFVQNGLPAIAFTAEKVMEHMATVTHTSRDTPDLVDCGKLQETALALHDLIVEWRSVGPPTPNLGS